MKIEGSLLGQPIITYRPKGNKKYSPQEIGQYLRQFTLWKALAFIGRISFENLLPKYRETLHIKGVPISDGILAYLSMLLVKNSNDHRGKEMQIDDLLKAIDMYFGLTDPLLEHERDNIDGYFIRLGAFEFDYSTSISTHLISRSLIIFKHLWIEVDKAKELDIDNALEKISGLNLEEILAITLVFVTTSTKGFFYSFEPESPFSDSLKSLASQDNQINFLKWIACGYKDFREAYDSKPPIKIEYDKSRFNPLIKKPVLMPDLNLTQGNHKVFLNPVPRLLYMRGTSGLYFDLADFFRDGGSNPFRIAFGSVFQEYVGLLLKKSLGEENIKSEWRYGSKKNSKDTPDWLVIGNNRAILIEVKQSCLYLESKLWGDIETIKKNLKNTIGFGVSQIWKFENDIKNGQYDELSFLSEIDVFEHIIITYDRSYFLNSALRKQIKTIYSEIPENYHWHTISIDELEYFLPLASSRIFEFLEKKRVGLYADAMDFKEYCIQEFADCNWSNPYLNDVYEEFLSELGLPKPSLEIS
jgi:hypothetical protein